MKQLDLFTSERAKASPVAAIAAPAPALPARWTGCYTCTRGGGYFRFYWQQRNKAGVWKTRHLHIRGGNVNNPVAISNRAAVDAAIAAGASVDKIKLIVRSASRHTGNHKKIPNLA